MAYTVLALVIYGLGTRLLPFFGREKIIYSIFLLVPLVTTIWLLGANHFVQTISTISISASFLRMRSDNNDTVSENRLWYIYYFFFLIYLGWSITALTQDSISEQQIIVILLIIFALIWLVFYIAGKKFDHTQHRTIGSILLLAIIGRIFVVELWQLSLIMKIVVCLVIGTLMIGSEFIGNKKKEV